MGGRVGERVEWAVLAVGARAHRQREAAVGPERSLVDEDMDEHEAIGSLCQRGLTNEAQCDV